MADEEDAEGLPFTVDARIVAQLGEQLVPTDLMALAELVKNSYDADATVVSIDYTEESGRPELIVEDDGNGMDREQIRLGWMHIGTAAKERDPLSPRYRRPCAGIKGVGRFAAQRLGDEMSLSTTARGSQTTLVMNFKWREFSAGRALRSILHKIEQKQERARNAHGTRLSITGLHRSWTISDLSEVIKDLARIHAPPTKPSENRDQGDDPGFEVVAAFHGEDGVELIDERDLLRDERVVHLRGEIDAEGLGHYDLQFFQPRHEPKRVEFRRKLNTGPLTFDIDLAYLSAKWIDELGVRKARTIGRKHGGVRIWRDGFRVFPYGEPSDDWLGLEAHIAARREPLNLWRSQGILGGVRITREANPGLQDLLTRRGMLETKAYEDLRTFVFEGLVIAATEHSAISARKTRSGPRRPRPSEALESALEAVARSPSASTTPATEVADQLVQSVREAELEIINENQMLKVLASLGTGLAVFSHEMKTVSLDVAVSAQELDRLARELPDAFGSRVQSEAVRLRSGIESLATYARYVEDFVSEKSRVRRRTIELSEFLETFFSVFEPLLNRREIDYNLDVPRGLWLCPMFPAELISIYFNLLTNAVKALLAPGVDIRAIEVSAGLDGDHVAAVFADSGCGIPRDAEAEIFDPFVTRSHDPGDLSLGRGTGLGLYIVREIVSDYHGTVFIAAPSSRYSTRITVLLPSKRPT